MRDEKTAVRAGDEFKELQTMAPDARVSPVEGIAAIALSMAMKYHDINTVQDGALYQQYKLEGKNMQGLHLDHVLHTATQIEAWLLRAPERIAKVIIEEIPEEQEGLDATEEQGSELS